MDIDLLSKMVAELILDNDEVALPGVGSFVAEFVPSSFSDKGYTINPPYRRLSFRQKESNDTKLIDFYATQNHLDTRTAASILAKFLLEKREILKTKKTIVFPGLGRLRATRENNFFFVPDEDLNIYPEGFGLEPVSLKTHVETEDEVSVMVENLQSIIGPAAPQEPEPVPEPVLEPASVPASEPAYEPEQKSEPVPESTIPEPVQTAAAFAAPVPKPAAAPALEKHESRSQRLPEHKKHKKRGLPIGWLVIIYAVAAIILLFVIFIIVAHLAPDFIDRILYNQEELELIRTFQL